MAYILLQYFSCIINYVQYDNMTKYNKVSDILLQITMMTSPPLAQVECEVVREDEVCQQVEAVVELRRLRPSPCLDANDESLGNAANDKLYKVRDFVNRINRNFSNNYSMGCNISIDESLIPFKGRLG